MAAKRICSIEGCGKRHEARGWCNRHYLMWKAHGDPLAGRKRAEDGESARWLENVARTFSSEECLMWPFGRGRDGYGLLDDGHGTKVRAHRIVCENANGPAPSSNHVARHNCGNGHLGCVNPAHIEWGTQFDNCQDTVEHGRSTRGERNAQAKLTADDVVSIRSLALTGTHAVIAAKFGVSRRTISDIVSRRSWAWLK